MKRIIAIICLVAFVFCSCAFAEGATEYTELSKGSKGEDVKALQERLKELGYYSIKVDSSYGNGTVKAITSFQARNGLEQDGIATIELQELLFSEKAIKAPFEALVFPKQLKLSGGNCYYRIQNNSGEKVDSVRTLCYAIGTDGKIISDKPISYERNLLTKDWGVTETIANGRSGMQRYMNTDYAGWECKMAKVFAIGVIAYHTESGNTVVFAPDDVTYYFTDGTIQYPVNDAEPYIYSDSEAAEIAELRTGLTLKNIYPFTAEFYGTVEGLYVLDVAGNSLGERAGFKAGDIITAIDGEEALLVPTQHKAAKKILNGDSAEYTYMRNGEEHTVSVSLDMETVQDNSESGSTPTIADELLKYGELLEKGLITQEEYYTLKDKLING